MTEAKLAVKVRWMIRRDMPEVVEIERLSFPYPWSARVFVNTLGRRNYTGMVALDREEVVGFVVYALEQGRLDVINLAVRPDCRRVGVGRQLLDALVDKLPCIKRDRVRAAVMERDLDSQLWLRACGFRCAAILRDPDDDADAVYVFDRLRNEAEAALKEGE